MIYTIEAKAIVDEHHGRKAHIEKIRGGVVYLTKDDARHALRTARGVVKVRCGGLHKVCEMDGAVYGVKAEEKDTIAQEGVDELRLRQVALIVELVEGEDV
jgi:hypothetical protein